MVIAQLADKLLQRIVPTVDAGACTYDWCGCYRYLGRCRNKYTDCSGNCKRWGTYCGVGVNC